VKQFAAEQLSENLGEFLRVLRSGEEATITDSGKAVAEVKPLPLKREPKFGTMAGKIWAAPGWEKPDPEITALFENSNLE
jgi:antitoxin (DNA-binding transcriptional repressor) of toxin-antitoxin stability system